MACVSQEASSWRFMLIIEESSKTEALENLSRNWEFLSISFHQRRLSKQSSHEPRLLEKIFIGFFHRFSLSLLQGFKCVWWRIPQCQVTNEFCLLACLPSENHTQVSGFRVLHDSGRNASFIDRVKRKECRVKWSFRHG